MPKTSKSRPRKSRPRKSRAKKPSSKKSRVTKSGVRKVSRNGKARAAESRSANGRGARRGRSVGAPTKIVCIGLNYAKHALEFGNPIPKEPLVFLKPPSSLIGPGEPIVIPEWAGQVDFEGEIGVRIGKRARHVQKKDAWGYVDGLLAINDVTARALQRGDGQWSRAKGFDTFCPAGKVTPLAKVDLKALSVTTRVNGNVRQQSGADDMVFDIPALIAHITRFMTLEPGDLIATGTPSGVGPLVPGDVVEIEIGGVGSVSNPVVAES